MRSQRLRGEDPVMDAITRSMGNLIRCMNRYRAEHLAPLALKPCHAGYLLEICACPGISQEQLSRRIYANKSNVARQLAALEEGGAKGGMSSSMDALPLGPRMNHRPSRITSTVMTRRGRP